MVQGGCPEQLPTSCSGQHSITGSRQGIQKGSHQVPGIIPKAKGMFPPKEAPEFMTENVANGDKQEKAKIQKQNKQTNPKREPHNFDNFSDFTLY